MGISLWINLVGRPEGLPFLGLKAGFKMMAIPPIARQYMV